MGRAGGPKGLVDHLHSTGYPDVGSDCGEDGRHDANVIDYLHLYSLARQTRVVVPSSRPDDDAVVLRLPVLVAAVVVAAGILYQGQASGQCGPGEFLDIGDPLCATLPGDSVPGTFPGGALNGDVCLEDPTRLDDQEHCDQYRGQNNGKLRQGLAS